MRKLIFILCLAFMSVTAFSQTTVWNPAANPESTGLWTETANWTNGLPVPAGKVVLNVTGAADCVLDAEASINQFVLGDNGGGDDVLRIVEGGTLTTGATWSAVAWSTDASIIVEKGGTLSLGQHFWAGVNGHATVDIYGTVNVAGMYGIAFEAGWNGSGVTSVIDDGVLNLANIHPDQSIPDGSFLDVTKNGVINIDGDHVAKIENYISLGRITANGGVATPIVGLIDGKTVISVEDIAVEEITVEGEGGATTITKGGGTLQMTASVLPVNSKDPSITWSVDDETIATIDANGLLTAVANGDVTVTATANDGSGVTGTLLVTVDIPGTTVWNPAANAESTGLWTEAENWTNGLPLTTSKIVLNVADAVDCVLDAPAAINQFVLGDNGAGDDVLRIVEGGTLTTGATWSAVAYSTDATIIVEKGGILSLGEHFWAGVNGHATVDIYGTVNVAAMYGIAFEAGWNGSGVTSVIDDGVLNLANIHPTQSIPDGSYLDVTNGGVINIDLDHVATVENYISLGRITADGGAGTPIVELIDGKTVISAQIKVAEITVEGADGASTITKGGGTLQMNASVLPLDAADPSVTWSVDDATVATIDANGLLTAVANGDVTVTATANDGSGVTGTLLVTVDIPGTTVWNPAANAESTGLWTEAENWTNGLPLATSKIVLNVEDAADCVLDAPAAINQFVLGDNGAGDDVLRIVDGGSLTTGATWSAVAHSTDATIIVEKGGIVSLGQHFWAGVNGHATVDIYGTVNVAGMYGIAFEAGWNGSGVTSVIDDGVLNLANIHPDQSIPDGSYLDVTNGGIINIDGDHVSKVENYIAQGRITANGGDATPKVEIIDGTTVISVLVIVDVEEITVTGADEATTISTMGGTLQMTADVLPAEATDPSVTWSVDDEAVATIDANGLLTAVSNGVVTVTATANDGSGITGSLAVTVTNQDETGIGSADLLAKGLTIYPNPAGEILNISSSRDIAAISIIDITGNSVREIGNPVKESTISLAGMPAGVYILKFRDHDANTVTRRILKQ